MVKLGICVPTYNKVKYLKKNIDMLCSIIKELGLEKNLLIYVSDNCSNDETEKYMQHVIQNSIEVDIKYHRNEKNIGAIGNFIYAIEHTEAEYIMLLGDDDFISKEYLKKVYESVNNDIACIVPSYINIDTNGKFNGRQRDVGCPSRIYEKGFLNCLENSWRGHQMSGLVFDRKLICTEMKRIKSRNPYLTIYWVGYMCMKGKTFHLTDYPVMVTRPPQKDKDWGYGEAGLIPEVFSNYKLMDELSAFQRFRLEMNFLIKQYWRYAMYIKKGPRQFLKCIAQIVSSENTSVLTKIIFPLTCIFILVGQTFHLLFQGKLLTTLRTKVDI